MQKPDFEGYKYHIRNDIKKMYEKEQHPLGVVENQLPDHPSTFMKTVKGRLQATSAANDKRC
jgi:hypothetical protein